MEKFSARLSRYRKAIGVTQEEMGNRLGITGKYVGMLEREEQFPKEGSTLPLFLDSLIARLENPTQSDLTATQWQFPKTPTESEFSGLRETHGRGLLKAAREAKGLTQSQLAASVGYSLAVYQSIEEGHSNMSEKMAKRVAKELDLDVADLLNGSDHPPANGGHFGTVGATPDLQMPPGQKARFVPMLSMAQCGTMGAYDDSAYDHTGFLAMNPSAKAFAVKLAGDSMTPKIEPGDVAIVHPDSVPRNGGLVLARLNDDHGGDVMLKLYQGTKDQVTLSSYNPAYPAMTHPRSSFSWIYPIASVTRVFD